MRPIAPDLSEDPIDQGSAAATRLAMNVPKRMQGSRIERNITMPVPSHTKAAEHHTNAAAEHKAAADLHGKGQHAAALEKSTKAHGSGDAAQKASTDAHGKSAAHAKK
jgi:hypothetical protein